MPYYQGDYYRGGFFGSLFKGIGKLAGGLLGIGGGGGGGAAKALPTIIQNCSCVAIQCCPRLARRASWLAAQRWRTHAECIQRSPPLLEGDDDTE